MAWSESVCSATHPSSTSGGTSATCGTGGTGSTVDTRPVTLALFAQAVAHSAKHELQPLAQLTPRTDYVASKWLLGEA